MRYLQKGQAIVEFAVILPLFLLFVIGILYFGMAMADYLTLSSIARSSAREASLIDKEVYTKNNKYETIRIKYVDNELPIDIFDWDPKNQKDNFKIIYEKNSQNVKVEIKADLNKNGAGYTLVSVFDNIIGSDMKNFKLNIKYTMYSEHKLE